MQGHNGSEPPCYIDEKNEAQKSLDQVHAVRQMKDQCRP